VTDLNDQLRGFWDRDAETYDLSPSHAATDPVEAAVWRAILVRHLPNRGASVLDVGAGTGAISLLAGELGYRVTALDLSPAMLGRAEAKARERRLDLDTVVGPAAEPPPGPFDAIIERHLLWTLPEPVAALSAWRRVAPEGRLLLFEGIWERTGRVAKARGTMTHVARRAFGVRHDHHAEYDPDLLASLPLAGARTPEPLIRAVEEAGWRAIRIERLRDVEWARRLAAPAPLGWLETMPHYALIAEA
jgi:SAM-dependent methyltransferase